MDDRVRHIRIIGDNHGKNKNPIGAVRCSGCNKYLIDPVEIANKRCKTCGILETTVRCSRCNKDLIDPTEIANRKCKTCNILETLEASKNRMKTVQEHQKAVTKDLRNTNDSENSNGQPI